MGKGILPGLAVVPSWVGTSRADSPKWGAIAVLAGWGRALLLGAREIQIEGSQGNSALRLWPPLLAVVAVILS